VNTARTVSDTKRAFYDAHTRPINSIYRRVVDELMVEMHLLTVNQHYAYSPIYALGVVTTFDRFMQGYRPETDLDSIFPALCKSVGGDLSKYRQDAEQLVNGLASTTWESFATGKAEGPVGNALKAVSDNTSFKYSRLFAIGLYTLLAKIDPEAAKDKDKLNPILTQLTEMLHFSPERLEKDLEIYRGNLDKMEQAQIAIADQLAADRRRRDQRDQEKAAAAANNSTPADASDVPVE
jgi:photosystem II biogenesis protein Psp29